MMHSSFFFNDTGTTDIYTLSLHDALPISRRNTESVRADHRHATCARRETRRSQGTQDRKSTRLNSSHSQISYAVSRLKKKKTMQRYASHPRTRTHQYRPCQHDTDFLRVQR